MFFRIVLSGWKEWPLRSWPHPAHLFISLISHPAVPLAVAGALWAHLPHVVNFELGEEPDTSFFQIRITKARLVQDRVLELAIAVREDGAPWKRVWRDGHPAEALTT